VGNHFSQAGERDDLALYNTLVNIADYLSINRKILRPVEPSKNMTDSFTDADMDTMISRFEKFRNSAKKAVMGIEKKEAQETWLSLFGDDFPKFVEEKNNGVSSNNTITRENRPWGN
jgi:hypothetical protein